MSGELSVRFEEHLRRTGLFDSVRTVVVACSGGGDSTALLVLVVEWARRHGVTAVASHVAHGLRGAAGDLDARAVADLTAALDIPFALRPVEVKELRRKGESLEAAGRRLRYEALLALARELGEGTVVATGHTLDDQAETVLMNLARHARRSRGGIRPRRGDGVVRPLLPFSRVELRAFLSARGIAWREDETNLDERFQRNRIRRRTLPELENASPGAIGRLARAGEAWTRRLEAVDASIDRLLSGAGVGATGPFPRGLFDGLSDEIAGRLLVRACAGAGKVPGRAQLLRVLARLRQGDRFEEALGGHRLSANARSVWLLPAKLRGDALRRTLRAAGDRPEGSGDRTQDH